LAAPAAVFAEASAVARPHGCRSQSTHDIQPDGWLGRNGEESDPSRLFARSTQFALGVGSAG